jgi:hypothetical protein
VTEESGIAVRDLLPAEIGRIEHTMQSELAKESKSGSTSLPAFAWRIAGTEATTAMKEALDGDVFSLLARGWSVARELAQYRDQTKYPPGQKTIVYLGEHSLNTEVHPVLTLFVGPMQCKALRFTLELKATFRSAALLIQDAHITGLAAGDCFASAQLKYNDIALHDELTSKHLVLPGRLQFKSPGISIQ